MTPRHGRGKTRMEGEKGTWDLQIMGSLNPDYYQATLEVGAAKGASPLVLAIAQDCPEHDSMHVAVMAPIDHDRELPELAHALRKLADGLDRAAVDPSLTVENLDGED